MIDPVTGIAAISAALNALEKLQALYAKIFSKSGETGDKEETDRLIKETSEQLQIAKAQIAKGFDYPLCRRHFPPGVMVKVGAGREEHWECISCHDVPRSASYQRATTDFDPFDDP